MSNHLATSRNVGTLFDSRAKDTRPTRPRDKHSSRRHPPQPAQQTPEQTSTSGARDIVPPQSRMQLPPGATPDTSRKPWNSNDPISKPETSRRELHAAFLGKHARHEPCLRQLSYGLSNSISDKARVDSTTTDILRVRSSNVLTRRNGHLRVLGVSERRLLSCIANAFFRRANEPYDRFREQANNKHHR